MGQVALGVRSLLIKVAVFVALASALAWALGGTLWPRPQVAQFDQVSFNGREWHWQLAVGGARSEPSWVRWTMMQRTESGVAVTVDEREWIDVAGPVVTESALYYAGRQKHDRQWTMVRIVDGDTHEYTLPDRLAVEQQLARVQAGLTVQDADSIEQQRDLVLDPAL